MYTEIIERENERSGISVLTHTQWGCSLHVSPPSMSTTSPCMTIPLVTALLPPRHFRDRHAWTTGGSSQWECVKIVLLLDIWDLTVMCRRELLILILFFGDRILLYNSGYVTQAGFELSDPPASSS